MAITNEAGKELEVANKGNQPESALPPVVEPPLETPAEQKTEVPGEPPRRQASFSRPTFQTPSFATSRERRHQTHFFNLSNSQMDNIPDQDWPENNKSIIETERFFSAYINQLFSTWTEEENADLKEAVNKAVLFVHALRDMVQQQTRLHIATRSFMIDDPFFQTPQIPGMKVIMRDEEFAIASDVLLFEYIHRLMQHHPMVPISRMLMDFQGGSGLRVAIAVDDVGKNCHTLVMAPPDFMLHEIVSGRLKIE